ncbi:MAG: universal stress protein UspB [Vibrio sp.]
MLGIDMFLLALFIVTCVNVARCFSALRSLLYIMREAHPLLYQQVDGRVFFSLQGNFAKQVRLYHYLKNRDYQKHHDDVFTAKCERVRHLFGLNAALLVVMLAAMLIV